MSKVKSMFNLGCGYTLISDYIQTEFGLLFNHFALLSKGRFKWKNLPKGMESRHIEKALFRSGQAFFFENKDKTGYLCLPCKPSGKFNVYGDPVSYDIYGYNGEVFSKNADEGVLIRENDECIPMSQFIAYNVEKLDETSKTTRQNLKHQRKPYIISCTKNNEASMKKMYEKIDKGEDAIYIDERKNQGGDIGVEILKTNSDFQIDKLENYYEKVETKILTMLGINNANTSKKERLISDEVNANNNNILSNLERSYQPRLLACNQINDMFELNIDVIKTIDELDTTFNGNEKNNVKKLDL